MAKEWLLIPLIIIEKVEETCIVKEGRFSPETLNSSLSKFVNKELEALDADLYSFYKTEIKGLEVETLKRALNKRSDSGVYLKNNRKLLDLLPYYAFNMGWQKTLKSLNIAEKDIEYRSSRKAGNSSPKANDIEESKAAEPVKASELLFQFDEKKFPPLTYNLEKDFSMVKELGPWVKLDGNRVIISSADKRIIINLKRNLITKRTKISEDRLWGKFFPAQRINYKRTKSFFLWRYLKYRYYSDAFKELLKRKRISCSVSRANWRLGGKWNMTEKVKSDFEIFEFSYHYCIAYSWFEFRLKVNIDKRHSKEFSLCIYDNFKNSTVSMHHFFFILMAYITGIDAPILAKRIKESGHPVSYIDLHVKICIEDYN